MSNKVARVSIRREYKIRDPEYECGSDSIFVSIARKDTEYDVDELLLIGITQFGYGCDEQKENKLYALYRRRASLICDMFNENHSLIVRE